MNKRKDYKVKHVTESQKIMINAMASGLSSTLRHSVAERKYKLIEINPHPDNEAVIQHYLSPVNLRHVRIFKDQSVTLFCGYDDQIRITISEWERIRSDFGYSDPSRPSLENLINTQCLLEEVDTE